MLSYKTLILCVTVFIWLNVVPVLGDGQQSFKDTKVKVKVIIRKLKLFQALPSALNSKFNSQSLNSQTKGAQTMP